MLCRCHRLDKEVKAHVASSGFLRVRVGAEPAYGYSRLFCSRRYRQLNISAAQERSYIEQLSPVQYLIKQGFVPNMRVQAHFYVNDRLKHLVFEELQTFCQRGDVGGFLPAVKQLCNVAGLPGIVKVAAQAVVTCTLTCWLP